jgi:hypothetical protein
MRAENARPLSASLAVLCQRRSTPPCRRSTCHLSRIVRVRTIDGPCCHFFLAFDRFSLSLSQRIEYLTLAVGNAKSHPVSAGGKHESAISFLTDLEEKLEVSQVQLEIFHTLSPRLQSQPPDPDLREKVELLERGLFNITEVPVLICFARARWLITVT